MAESQTTVFGAVEVAFSSVDDGKSGFNDNGSTIGFAHEHSLSEGVTAFANVEFAFDVDDDNLGDDDEGGDTPLNGLDSVDTAFVGVKGDFGTVIYGVDDTVYDWVDVVDTGEVVGLGGGIADTKDHEFIQYVSPEIADGVTVGVTVPVESDANFAGALAAKYATEDLEVVFAYAMSREEDGVDGNDTIALGATYSMDDITVMGQYEMEDDVADYLAIQGAYAMGQNSFSLGYGLTSPDGNGDDTSEIFLQAMHNASDNLSLYLEYEVQSDPDLDTLAVGTIYSF